MMEEKDKLRSFYDNVSSYLDIGSYDDFYGAMQDPSRRQKFFDNTSQYVDIGDSDKFNQFVGDYFGQQQPAQRVDVSDVEAQQQPNVPTATMEEVGNEPVQVTTQPKNADNVNFVGTETQNVSPMVDFAQRVGGKITDWYNGRQDRKAQAQQESAVRGYELLGREEYQAPEQLSAEGYDTILKDRDALKKEYDEAVKEYNKGLRKASGYQRLGLSGEYNKEKEDKLARINALNDAIDKTLKYEYDYLHTPEGQAQMKAYEEYCDQVDAMIKEAGGDKYTWQGRLARAFAGTSPTDIKAKTQQEIDEEVEMATRGNQLIKAQRDVNNARRQLRLTKERLEGDYSGFRRGWRATDVEGLSRINDFADNMTQLGLAKKVREGKELNEADKVLLAANQLKTNVDWEYASSNTMGERVGMETADQLVTTAEFLLGSYLTGSMELSGEVSKRVLSKMGSKAAKDAVISESRNLLRTGVAEGVGMAAGAGVQTFANPLSYLNMMSDYAEKRTGTIHYDPSDGQIHYFDDQKSIALSLWQAAAGAYVENLTEFSGVGLDKLGKLGMGNIYKAVPELEAAVGTVSGFLDKVKFSKITGLNAPAMDDYLRHAGFNGTLGEYGEEVLGNIVRPFLYVETEKGDSYGKQLGRGMKNLVDADQNLETLLSCAVTGVFLGATATARQSAMQGISTAAERRGLRNNLAKLDVMLDDVSNLDKNEFKDYIANHNISEISQYIKDQAKANNWSEDELGMVSLYVINSAAQQAYFNQNNEQIQQTIDGLAEQAQQLVNKWDGEHIYNVTFTDPQTGQTMQGAVVDGRMHYEQNEDGTYKFNPYISSGMLAIRLADGTVKQVSSRQVTSLDNVMTIDEQLESQGNTVRNLMEGQFSEDDIMPTVESAWGFEFEPNNTVLYGRYEYMGKDKDGNYAFLDNQAKSNEDAIVSFTEEELIRQGLQTGITLMRNQQQNDATFDTVMETVGRMEADADLMTELEQMKKYSRSVKSEGYTNWLWNTMQKTTSRFVTIDENGLYDEDKTTPNDAAVDLYARNKGNMQATQEAVRKAMAALAAQAQQSDVEAGMNATPSAVANSDTQAASGENTTRSAKQMAFLEEVGKVLGMMQARVEQLQQNDAMEEEQRVQNMPVSQMEVGQQFPVEWRGQQAMATVMGKDADGRSVVTVRDMEGDDIEAGIDDMSDAEWEGVRVQPQEATEQASNSPKTLDDITDEDIPKRENGTVIYYEINDPMVYAKAALMEEGSVESALRMIDEDISGLQRDLNDYRFRERAEARLKIMEEVKQILLSLQQQPISQEETQPQVETPEPAPQPEPQPQQEAQQEPQLPRDKDGNIDYGQITDPALYAQGLLEEFGDEAIDTINELIAEENENYTMAIEKKNAIERRRAQKESQGKLDFYYKVKDALAPQEQVETTTEEAAPIEETPVTETPIAEAPTEETPVEEVQPEQAPEQVEGTPQEPVEQPKEEKKPEKKDTEFQKRIAAVGEPKTLEDAILIDIALGGAKFRWGNRDEDKRVLKRGIGDLWKYSQQEFKKRIGIMKKDGYSIETYAEAILEGRLMDYSGVVSQIAENMDMRDIVDAIEDVLQMVRTKTEALEALESKRREESEEEQRYIRSLQDQEARDMGFDGWEDYEAYQQSLEENNLTDADYEEINRIFAEQTQEEDEQRARSSESEGDTAANQSDEQQGVRGESEGSTGVLQGTQVTDTGAVEPTGQGTRSESGDTANASSQGEGASEVRSEIDRLQAQRENIIRQRDEIQQRYEQANGLFGDTQAEESDLFGGQNFLSPELAQATIDGYNRQIKQIDEQIAKLEASLKRAEGVTQTEIEEAADVAPEDIETAAANPAATETKVEKGLTEEEVDAAEGIDTQTKLLAKEYIKGNKNELTKDAYEEVREYYAERGRRNPEQDGGAASGTQLAAADNETADQRSGGQRGVESGRVDRGRGEETLSENGRRGEDGTQQPSATAGEQSVDSGNGEQLGTSGQPVDSGNTTGGGRSGGNGSDVRQPRGEEEGSGVSGTGTRGQSGTSQRRSSDEIDKDIADDLAEISGLFAKEMPLSQDERTKTRNREVELPQPMNNESEPAEEPQAIDPKWFRNVRKAIFKLAGHVFEKGYNQFDEWKNKIKDLLHSAVKNFRDRLSDERLDQLLADAWECPFEYNGEVKTIREWASELHAAEVRKMISKSIEEKQKEQAEANKRGIKQVYGDLDNIKESLPFLLPHQQENVAKAERQFFTKEHADREHGYGKGFCFTDGTGTGKTFTGLGIARRFVNEGKGRILILTTKTKVSDWVKDAGKLGLEASSLEEVAKREKKTATQVKGSGIVVTTYANASQNKALMEDAFDLVIYDESHYIMNNKGGNETISTKTHYMLTNKNIENALARLQENHPLWIREQELIEERQQQTDILNNPDASYTAHKEAQENIVRIDGQMKQLKQQQADELPAMREKAAEAAKRTKAVFLSATPFKAIDNLEYAEGYIFSYPEEDPNTKGSVDHRSGKDEFKLRFFGSMFRWRHHQIEQHIQNLDAAVQQQQAFADRLMNTLQTMSGAVLDNGYDYSRHFPLVEVAMADQFNAAVEALNRDPVLKKLNEYFPFDDYQKMSLLFEVMKVAAVTPRIKEHLERGRKVVIFTRRTNYSQTSDWRPQNPFTEGLATALATAMQSDEKKKAEIMNAVNLFQERYGSLIVWADTLDYRLPSEQLHDIFGDKIDIINGSVTGKKREAIINKFNRDDDKGLDLLLGQERTMREGISIHDTTGKKQRVIVSLALPQETTTFLQGEGRTYRIGNKSNAIYEYPLLGINRELQLFALSFNAAVGVTENLAIGSNARNLARSIAKGVMEDSGVVPLDNQGTGGREKDYGKSTRDAYSAAINDYYSNQKQKSGRENRLGVDYYATPEPLGFKMVQWLNLAEGEEVLEPSAGHGAIARYFPNNVRSLAIEPSDALFTMLALNTGGVDKDNAAQAAGKNKFVQNGTFEDLKTVNKYDAIAMNPPFGKAGATAIEHLTKAWQHLNNSGRIAIIVPTGAMDAKMEKWLDEHKNAVVVGEIKLPSVTFQQAGTAVSTRLLLIDRVDRASFRQKVAAKKVSLDLTTVQNIDELFRELRDVDMPSRLIDPSTKLIRHGEALRTKLINNDMIPYKRNPETDRRSKNMGKSFTVGEDGVTFEFDKSKYSINRSVYQTQRASWNEIKKLKGKEGSTFFNPSGYVMLSDIANCETADECLNKHLIFIHSTKTMQEEFDRAKEFAEAMTDFIRRVTGFTDEQIRDYAAGRVDLFDYTKIKDNAKIDFADLTRRYEDMEQDPMLQALFERVTTIAERLGMKIETFNDPYSTVMGSYNPFTNTLRINSGRWNNPNESDSAKSQTILHELIHSVTTYALNAYKKEVQMSKGLKEACRRTMEIYENIKGDYVRYYGSTPTLAPDDAPKEAKYGFADPEEMLAEMANPVFRKYMQKKGLWTKLVDGIKRILNYLGLQNLGVRFKNDMSNEQYRRWYGTDKENVEAATNAGWVATNAFDELSETLDMFLDNFDAALYERRNDGIVRSNIVDREGTKEEGIEYSIRELPAPKKTGKGYKVFVLKDGQLYPPMVANPNGASTPVGYWLDADAAPVVGESKTGRAQVKAGGKGTQGGSGQLAYRPGWHLGEIPYALQFNRKDENGEKTLFPKDFVWAEVEYADDVNYQEEAESYGVTENGKYRHSYAGLPRVPVDGSYRYRTNPNPETDPWIITGAMRVNRILTPSEVDAMVREAGREPQRRQEGAVTDEQVNALNEALGLNDELYRDQQEWDSGTELDITKDENGYRVEGLNDSYPNVDRLLDAWRDAHPDYIAEIRDGKLYVEKWSMPEPRTAKESRRRKASAERGWRRAHQRANDTIKKLGLQDNVTILDSTRGLKGKQKTAKGWFDPNTGKIVIVMPNHVDAQDVVKTILHEGVAHYGLRKLVGDENMNDFLDKVFESASKEVRDRIIKLAADKYGYNFRKATEEYLAGLAEDTNFERATDRAWFAKIKTWFVEMLHRVGIDFGNMEEFGTPNNMRKFTDNELRYILWKSYRNLVADAESRTEIARDAMMQSQLGVGNYAPQTVAAESMMREDGTYGTNMADVSGVISDKGEINNERLNEIIKSVQEGRAKVSRIPSGLGEAHETVPAIAAQAIAQGYFDSEFAGNGSGEGEFPRVFKRGTRQALKREVSKVGNLIKQWAKYNGYWFDEAQLKKQGTEIMGGAESRVFVSENGNTVVKSTAPYVHNGYVQLVIESMEMFGRVFQNTPYTIVGFAEENGHLCVVATQPYVQGMSLGEYAEQQGWVDEDGQVDYDKMMGYVDQAMREQFGLERRAGYGNYTDGTYNVTDAHRKNVIVDAEGNLSVIDASVYLNDDDYDNDDILFRDAEPANKIADEYNRMTGANVDGVNDVKRGWEQFARGQLDDMRPLEQMQKLIAKALGRELRDSEKAYELATQLVSKTGRQIDRENLDYMVPMLQQVTSAMRSLMDSDGISREDAYKMVNDYLLAKHGLERNEWFIKQGKKDGDYAGLRGLAESLGENPDDYKAVAERIVNEFEQQVDTKDLWKSMKSLTDRMLEISYETGMIDKDTYEDLKQRYKNYVPLRGFAEGTASDLFDYVSQSPHYQNIMKTAKGRKSMADDSLGNLMNMLQSAIVIGNQNQVMQKIYNLAVNGKSDLLRISKPWYVYNDTTDTWEEKFPDIPEDATADEIDAIMKKFDADMQQLKAQGKAKQKRNRLEVGKKILPAEAREHRMIAYINGQKVAMHVAGNPLVAQAMNRMNTQHLNKVMQGIQTATRWYSSINTSWSPAFGPKNALRDIRFMLFSSFVEGGMKKQLSALGNILRATWVLPRMIVTGKMDSGITKMLNPNDAAQLEQWWNEFLDNGGETGFTRTLNAEKAKAEVKDMVRHMLNGSKDGENRVRKYTLGLLEEFGRYSEDISRFAAYCMQRAKGDTVLGSINEAKNMTVNFNVHGGSDLAANMRALYSFFNASMQGINRMRRLATEHPGRFIAGISALMLGGAVLPWLNMAMFAMLGGDDDDWRKYEELTEYTANHNMILYVGNHKFLSIPWSQELAPFNALGNIWFRQQMGWNKGKSVAEQWGDMLVDLSPVSVASGKKPGVGLVKTIMPSFTTPVWEAIFNEDFTGSPLYKDNQWNKYDAAWEKAYTGKTSQSVIDASRWLNEKTGIDINPAIAEHLFSGVLGGMGRSGDKLLRYFTNGFQLQDAPFIRTMMFDSNPKGYIGAVQREYGRLAYDVLPKAKHDAEDMTATEYAAFTQTEEYDIANTVSIYKTGKDLAGNKTSFQGIDKMEKEYKKVAGMSDGSEEYREQLEDLRLQITEYKMEMIDEIEQIKYEHSEEVTLDNLFGLRKRIMERVNEVEKQSKAKAK